MTKKQLQRAFDNYAKNKDLKLLSGTLIKLILYMAEHSKIGYERKFLEMLPYIADKLKSFGLEIDNSEKT